MKLLSAILFGVFLFIMALFMMGCAPHNYCEGHLRALEVQSAERCMDSGRIAVFTTQGYFSECREIKENKQNGNIQRKP